DPLVHNQVRYESHDLPTTSRSHRVPGNRRSLPTQTSAARIIAFHTKPARIAAHLQPNGSQSKPFSEQRTQLSHSFSTKTWLRFDKKHMLALLHPAATNRPQGRTRACAPQPYENTNLTLRLRIGNNE